MPVHLGGSAADMDAILAVAARHKLPVVEDACQAALAEWKGKKLSTLGDLGCFSFQASKNLNSGEGGAILTSDDRLALRVPELPEQRPRPAVGGLNYARNGANLRMTEFQAALAVDAAHPAGGAVPPPRAERRLPHRAAPRDPRHRPGADVRRLHPQCLSSLHVPL